MDEPITDVSAAMQETYDHYYASEGYRQRYPVPNTNTLNHVMAQGAAGASHILDFGCGNGRYALALLEMTSARLTGYDISVASLADFDAALQQTPHDDRVTLIHGDLGQLEEHQPYDMVLLLFGVLSHLGAHEKRIATLRKLRGMMPEHGKLILSVPNIWRRRPWELFKFALCRRLGCTSAPQTEPGNIFFTREINGLPVTFFYHLYSVDSLREELAYSGFRIRECAAESLLPEWLVTQSTLACWIDHLALRWLPAWLGYGIRVVAEPV